MCPDPNCRRKIYDTESVAKESLFLGRRNQVELQAVSQKMDAVSSKIDDVHDKVERIINQHEEEKIRKIEELKETINDTAKETRARKWQMITIIITALIALATSLILAYVIFVNNW